jgi:ParB/RepB/Spo0J family partition protein
VAVKPVPAFRTVPIDQLAANPWNPNRMDAFMFEREVASIEEFGFVDPITCRSVAGGYEIIDGEHRWNAARSLGLKTVPIIDLGEVPDQKAKKLTIVLNELRGQIVQADLGALIANLLSEENAGELAKSLPFTQEALEHLASMPEFSWDSTKDVGKPDISPPVTGKKEPWVELVFRMPKSANDVVMDALAKIRGDDEMLDWQALEALAADYLGK